MLPTCHILLGLTLLLAFSFATNRPTSNTASFIVLYQHLDRVTRRPSYDHSESTRIYALLSLCYIPPPKILLADCRIRIRLLSVLISTSAMDPNQMDPNQMVVTMDASWTAESYFDNNNNSLNLASLEAAMTATYNYSLAPMPSASQTSPDDCLPTPIFESDEFPQSTPRSRYTSLDYDRPDMGFLLPLERRHSLTNDAKESAKEVSDSTHAITMDHSGLISFTLQPHVTC